MYSILAFSVFVIMLANGEGLTLIPMTEWSGRPSLRKEPLQNPVNVVIIQHTVTSECTTDDQCQTIVRTMQKYQMETVEYDDIGYSFMIGGNGKVYEGAGWSKVGAHTRKYNKISLGIAFIGNFNNKLPTEAALKAAQDLFQYGVEKEHLSPDYKLMGHRQLTSTISPGDVLQNEITKWPHWAEHI